MDRLAAILTRPVECPVGLGSGRCSLAHKLNALMHARRACTKSWSDAAALCNSTVAWTTDLGTEKGF
eukprot:3220348-Alexandrium_andersonii.AAC.1